MKIWFERAVRYADGNYTQRFFGPYKSTTATGEVYATRAEFGHMTTVGKQVQVGGSPRFLKPLGEPGLFLRCRTMAAARDRVRAAYAKVKTI